MYFSVRICVLFYVCGILHQSVEHAVEEHGFQEVFFQHPCRCLFLRHVLKCEREGDVGVLVVVEFAQQNMAVVRYDGTAGVSVILFRGFFALHDAEQVVDGDGQLNADCRRCLAGGYSGNVSQADDVMQELWVG